MYKIIVAWEYVRLWQKGVFHFFGFGFG